MDGSEVVDEMAVVGNEDGLVGDAGSGGFFDDVAGAPLCGDDDYFYRLVEKSVAKLDLLACAGNVGACFVGVGVDHQREPLRIGLMMSAASRVPSRTVM